MAIWFTSDQHFGADSVIRYSGRPYKDAVEMDEDLVRRWVQVIAPTDTVYLLGDVFFCKFPRAREIARRLTGRILFIQGNHDKFSLTQYESLGWIVVREAKQEFLGKCFQLSHYPYWPNPDELPQCEPHYLRYPERRPIDRGEWLLCGHVHQRWQHQHRMINVGVDVWSYKPVHLGQIDKLIKKCGISSAG